MIKWDCGMAEWQDSICGDLQYVQYSSKVPAATRWFWIVCMIILSFSLTSDACDHLLYMNMASFIWKIKLLLQVLITINICFLNAILTAGQNTGFDMLMNAVALLALNDIDNIIASLFYIMSGINLDG